MSSIYTRLVLYLCIQTLCLATTWARTLDIPTIKQLLQKRPHCKVQVCINFSICCLHRHISYRVVVQKHRQTPFTFTTNGSMYKITNWPSFQFRNTKYISPARKFILGTQYFHIFRVAASQQLLEILNYYVGLICLLNNRLFFSSIITLI